MEDYELKRRMAESLRENIYKIPRRNREYEMTMQPMLQVNNTNDKISVKFTMKYKDKTFPSRMLVEKDGAYAHVSGVGSYLDKLFIKGKPDVICSEFVKWMKFARNGLIDGDYAFIFYQDRPVGFMAKPIDKKYSYAFFDNEISACGLKTQKVLELYSKVSYNGQKITCKKMNDTYVPQQAYGKGTQPVKTLDMATKQALIWSMAGNKLGNHNTSVGIS